MEEGVDGLLRDKTRPPGIAPLDRATVERVVAVTLKPPPHEATHRTGRAMASSGCRTLIGALNISTNSSIPWVVWFTRPNSYRRRDLPG